MDTDEKHRKEAVDFGYNATMGAIKALAVVAACIMGVVFVFAIISGIGQGIQASIDKMKVERIKREEIEFQKKLKEVYFHPASCAVDGCLVIGTKKNKDEDWFCGKHD